MKKNKKRRPMIAALCAFVGYAVAAVLGYWLAMQLSSNTHDRAVEAGVAAAFVWGPLGAVAAGVAGWLLGGGSGG